MRSIDKIYETYCKLGKIEDELEITHNINYVTLKNIDVNDSFKLKLSIPRSNKFFKLCEVVISGCDFRKYRSNHLTLRLVYDNILGWANDAFHSPERLFINLDKSKSSGNKIDIRLGYYGFNNDQRKRIIDLKRKIKELRKIKQKRALF